MEGDPGCESVPHIMFVCVTGRGPRSIFLCVRPSSKLSSIYCTESRQIRTWPSNLYIYIYIYIHIYIYIYLVVIRVASFKVYILIYIYEKLSDLVISWDRVVLLRKLIWLKDLYAQTHARTHTVHHSHLLEDMTSRLKDDRCFSIALLFAKNLAPVRLWCILEYKESVNSPQFIFKWRIFREFN